MAVVSWKPTFQRLKLRNQLSKGISNYKPQSYLCQTCFFSFKAMISSYFHIDNKYSGPKKISYNHVMYSGCLNWTNRPFARKDWNVNWFRDVTSGCQDAGEDCIGVYLEMTIWMFKTPASCTDLMLFYLNEYHMKI